MSQGFVCLKDLNNEVFWPVCTGARAKPDLVSEPTSFIDTTGASTQVFNCSSLLSTIHTAELHW